MEIKLFGNTKSYKYANPGSNKVAYGARIRRKILKFLIFEYAKLDFCKENC